MKRVLLAAFIVAFLCIGSARSPFKSADEGGRPMIEELSWMAGSWQCELWGGTFEEHWSKPAGGTMVGVGRHVANGKTSFMEFLSVEPHEDGLTMWILLGHASKGPKTAVPFKLTGSKPGEAVFENPKNDFPSKISYRRKENGDLFCRIEGEQNGKPAAEDFNFARIAGG